MNQSNLNPFSILEERLTNIENILGDLKKLNSEAIAPSDSAEDIGGILLAEQITGLAKPTIYALVSKKQIPYMKKGKRLYFSRSEIIGWIQSGKKKTIVEKPSEGKTFLKARKKINNE